MKISVQWHHSGIIEEGGQALLSKYYKNKIGKIWVDIQGSDFPEDIVSEFNIHKLSVVDAKRFRHPPKVESFEDHVFILQRGIESLDVELDLKHVQISLFVSENSLITYHQKDSFSIKAWWNNQDRLAMMDGHFILLASRLLNTLSTRYLDVLLEFENTLGELEDNVFTDMTDNTLNQLNRYRSRLRKLKRVFRYHEKTAENLLRFYKKSEPEILYNLQDLYEKNERLNSLSDMFYELSGDLIDGFLSMASHRLNNTMQVLTVITAIFVPLGFLAGLYGMNFDYIPELKVNNGYFILLGVMATVAFSLIFTFKRNKWL